MLCAGDKEQLSHAASVAAFVHHRYGFDSPKTRHVCACKQKAASAPRGRHVLTPAAAAAAAAAAVAATAAAAAAFAAAAVGCYACARDLLRNASLHAPPL